MTCASSSLKWQWLELGVVVQLDEVKDVLGLLWARVTLLYKNAGGMSSQVSHPSFKKAELGFFWSGAVDDPFVYNR